MTEQNGTYLVSCRACGSANRIPAEKEGMTGKCGACGKALLPLHTRPIPLTDASFDSFVGAYPGPVLAEFWAPW